MPDNVVIRYDIQGNGFDTENSAIFCSRIAFCELYSGDKKPLKQFFNDFSLRWPEPEVEEIVIVDGVSQVCVFNSDSLYNLHVKKAYCYTWDELTPKIIELLNKRYERMTAKNFDEEVSHGYDPTEDS